jgi:hypothetical protein
MTRTTTVKVYHINMFDRSLHLHVVLSLYSFPSFSSVSPSLPLPPPPVDSLSTSPLDGPVYANENTGKEPEEGGGGGEEEGMYEIPQLPVPT